MGLKTSKKNAMALILILIILTSLAVTIAASMKVLIIADSHSVNKIKNKEKKSQGKYICYKLPNANDGYSLYEQLIIYNSDGSIDEDNSKTNREPVGNCEFKIPNIAKLNVTVIGAGGNGNNATGNIKQDTKTSEGFSSISFNEIKNKIPIIIDLSHKINNGFSCGYNDKCLATFNAEDIKNSDGEKNYDGFFQGCLDEIIHNQVNLQEGGCISIADDKEYHNMQIEVPKINVLGKNTKARTFKEIKNYVNSLKKSSEEIQKISKITKITFLYKLKIPSAPETGKVITIPLQEIYGKDKSNKIIIKYNDIGEPSDNKKTTFFRYYEKNDNSEEKTIEADGGNNASTTETSVTTDKEHIYPHVYGEKPAGLTIPKDFNFLDDNNKNILYAGYIDQQGIPVNATFFGASGANGGITAHKLEDKTECYEFIAEGIHYGDFLPGCNAVANIESLTGNISKGAPGAIMIEW